MNPLHSSGRRGLGATLLVLLMTLLAGCERPPVTSVQHGYRGTAMVQVYNPRTVVAQEPSNALPEVPPPASAEGPKAGQVYQNVQVLKDLSIAQFARTMVSITAWVSPKEGCAYCHAGANFAEDSKYTKVVARRMLQMTQHVNASWQPHVAQTGVTCWTCHRGEPVPSQVWFGETPESTAGLNATRGGQNLPAKAADLASLPSDPFTPFLLQSERIRVIGDMPLPGANRQSIKQAEWTYSLMSHMSTSLGVNCTYCHNSRSFASWDTSAPQRTTAWYGIRMVRDLNNAYLQPLTNTFPAHRLGPTGDVAKINCGTCHQGAYKPMYGQSLLGSFPELAAPPAAAAPAPAASAAPATSSRAAPGADEPGTAATRLAAAAQR